MKKLLIALSALIIFCPKTFAQTDNIALLTKKGFFERPTQDSIFSSNEEVRRSLLAHLKYANTYNLEGLKALYADDYTNADGLNKEIYFDLIKKTWENYPDIRYRMDIKHIKVSGDRAVAQVSEDAIATTVSKSGIIDEKGILQSSSDSVYYFEKINNQWLITSDHIIFEKTALKYGSAKEIAAELSAPCQIYANTPYTATLKIHPPKDSLIIASVGKENITYPQTVAEEVFRKLPDDGILERLFKSNDKNINEYAVASYGITRAEIKNGTEIKIYVTGLGFAMSRVNVIPKNDFVKVNKNEKTK